MNDRTFLTRLIAADVVAFVVAFILVAPAVSGVSAFTVGALAATGINLGVTAYYMSGLSR